MKNNLLKIIVSALFAALTFVATFMVQIPAPFGYVNLGDCFVLLSGALLGPFYGFAAAGLGSALADLLLGFSVYAPATFLIKGVMALIIGLVAQKVNKRVVLKMALFGALCEILMVLSYLLYECFILGYGIAAAAAIPMNLFQGAVGLAAFLILYGVISRNKKLKIFLNV
ncbi:MAG: ECF transporter S component [Clostridia bacterium]|nr:ECF transporter S component [Clostridia bacterium]